METMTPEGANALTLESEHVHVVYDGKTGEIAHIHRVLTFAGGKATSLEQQAARALELARGFGHRPERLRVLRVDSYDRQLPQRVDVKAGKLVAIEPTTRTPAKTAKTATRPGRRGKPKR